MSRAWYGWHGHFPASRVASEKTPVGKGVRVAQQREDLRTVTDPLVVAQHGQFSERVCPKDNDFRGELSVPPAEDAKQSVMPPFFHPNRLLLRGPAIILTAGP